MTRLRNLAVAGLFGLGFLPIAAAMAVGPIAPPDSTCLRWHPDLLLTTAVSLQIVSVCDAYPTAPPMPPQNWTPPAYVGDCPTDQPYPCYYGDSGHP